MSLTSSYYDQDTGFLYRLNSDKTQLVKLPIEFLDKVEPHQTPSRLKPRFIEKFMNMVKNVLNSLPDWKVDKMGFDFMRTLRWEVVDSQGKRVEFDTAWCAAKYHEVLDDSKMSKAILDYISGV